MAPETGEYRGNELRRITWRSLVLSSTFARRSILSLSLSVVRSRPGGGWSLRRIWGIVSAPFLFFSVPSLPAIAHTPRSIYLKQMLSDAAPLCGGKMRPSSSLRSLLSHPLDPPLSPPFRSLSVPFFFPFTRARSLRRFARRSLSPLAAAEAGVLPRRFEELPVHGFPIPEKLASDMVSGVRFFERSMRPILRATLSGTCP